MGRIIFLSAVAFVAFKYIARSNKKHQEIAASMGNEQATMPATREPAALLPAGPAPKLLEHRSPAAEPDPAH
jgi:hypothetical protein